MRTIPLTSDERVNWRDASPFFLAHLVPLFAIVTGVTERALVLCGVSYVVRMFFITAGYHRYFAHRSYKTSRAFQLVLAIGGCTALQQGPLWWAAHHRKHHRYSDTDLDVHTPLKGFWWSQVGWFTADINCPVDFDAIADFAKFPELRVVDRFEWVPPTVLAGLSLLYAGWSGLVVGFFLSTVLLWHCTFFVNSLAHVFGRRRYATDDTSRNSFLIAFITLGEGWHNNHHHFPTSVRQGFYWWELDCSYYVLRLLSLIHVVHDLRRPSTTVLTSARLQDGAFDLGMFRSHLLKATARLPRPAGRVIGDAVLAEDREVLQACITSTLQAAETLSKDGRRVRRGATTPSR